MASPFHIFRKYQKTLLVIAGVLCMFVFVIGDSLMQFVGSGVQGGGGGGGDGRADSDVAVRWDGGSLTNRELRNLVFRRQVLNGFLQNLYQLGQRAAYEAGADISIPPQVELVAGVGQSMARVEQDVVQMRLFADAARDIGMDVSDDNIRHYLSEVGWKRVGTGEMRRLLSHSQFGGGQVPTDYLFQGLREELLARNFLASYQNAFLTVLPEQRWVDWLRVNDRVTVEAAAIPATQFLVDVKDPPEAELAAFFAEFQEQEELPAVVDNTELPSPNPGFAEPRRVKVQYVKADFNAMVAQLADEVTDEEIEDYYENNKDLFVRADGEIPESGADTSESSDESQAPADEPAAEETNPQAESPAEDSSAEDGASDETDTEIRGQSPDDDGDDNPTTEDEDSAEESGDPSAEADEETPAEDADDPSDAPNVQYQPLDEVRDDIRLSIAGRQVNDRITKLTGELYTQLKSAHTSWEGRVFDAEDDGKDPPPPPHELINLEALAAKHDLSFQRTGNLSRVELRDTEIGGTGNPDRYGRAPLWLAMHVDLEMYEPAETYDLDGNRYISMKIEDTPGRIPQLDEVRDEVVRAWKLREAAQLALQRAEEFAEQAQNSGGSLEEFFADDPRVEVTTTDPFSWLTIGNISPTTRQVFFRMSEPEGIDAAGPAFMSEVFSLEEDQVGAVLNHDHSIAYVVRVAGRFESKAALRQAFLEEADGWYGRPSMTNFHVREAAQSVVGDLTAASGVDWQRTPDVPPDEE